jgi:hypothetical protein
MEEPAKTRFDGPPAWIILFCNESPKTLEQIRDHVYGQGPQEETPSLVEESVAHLEERGFLYGERGKYLTLALPHNANL